MSLRKLIRSFLLSADGVVDQALTRIKSSGLRRPARIYSGVLSSVDGVVDQALTRIKSSGLRRPARIYSGAFVTTLNAPGVSITLMNVTQAANQASAEYKISLAEMLDLLDAPHASLSWVSAVKAHAVDSTDDLIAELPKHALDLSEQGHTKGESLYLRETLIEADPPAS